jgi:hypothetical protein
MAKSKKQIMSDTTMVRVLRARAVRVLENSKANLPSDQDRALGSEGGSWARRCRVDKQGYVTTKNDPETQA